MVVESDAWSDGQFRSKLWLANALEKITLGQQFPLNLWIFGSWYGLAAQVLLVRDRLKLGEIHLFDVDPKCGPIAKKLLNHWICQGLPIHFHLQDCEKLGEHSGFGQPSVVINTSCEHFRSYDWLEGIPAGALVVAQSTDMDHPTHILSPSNLGEFKEECGKLMNIILAEELRFVYPDKSFSRFMIIGRKQ